MVPFGSEGPTAPKLKAITLNGAIVVESEEDARKRKERRLARKSRWDNKGQKAQPKVAPSTSGRPTQSNLFTNPMSTPILALPAPGSIKDNPQAIADARFAAQAQIDMSKSSETQQQIFVLQMQINESTRMLARPDLGIPANPRDRSPSPEPVYNSSGKRINTRLERTKHKWVTQRNNAITRLKEIDSGYQPPSQYNYKNVKLEDKIFLPAKEHPDINFVGLILGPRGNYLEKIKKETNCNMIIRGKGSLKSGMTGITKTGTKVDGLEEELHVLVTASTAEDVQKGVKKIREIVEMQIYNPDCEQAVALRAKHMHDLAVLNGTVKEVEEKCLNCGRLGHKSWQCDEKPNFTSAVLCNACGGVGHLTKDCQQKRPGEVFQIKKEADPEVLDTEYQAFLADMGIKYEPKKEKGPAKDKPYVPPMALDPSRNLDMAAGKILPIMYTNGSSAPGAASSHARALSDPQKCGAARVVGTSIFGGKLTTMTAGYKSQAQLEYEREKKKKENEHTPVPTEWKVQQIEKNLNKNHDEYMKHLEKVRQKEMQAKEEIKKKLTLPPPPPPAPPAAAPSNPAGVTHKKYKPLQNQFVKSSTSNQPSDAPLPGLSYNPWKQFQQK